MNQIMVGDKKVKDKNLRPSDARDSVDYAIPANSDLRSSHSTGQISTTFTRSLSSDSQLPGAWAIPGPQLVRQQRITGLSPDDSHDREQEPHILVEARVVDEEQPSLIFEAFLLRKRKNWKWIVTVCCLLFLLTAAVAAMFIQESNRRKSPEVTARSQTNDQSTKIPPVAPVDGMVMTSIPTTFPTTSTQTNMPSIYKAMAQSPFPTLSTEQEKAPPTASPKEKPTVAPPEGQPQETSYFPSYNRSSAPTVLKSQGSSIPSGPFRPSSEPSYTNSLFPFVDTPPISPSIPFASNPSFMPSVYMPMWKEVGESIIGKDEGDTLGRSIAMSDDGMILAVGIYLPDLDTEQNTGKVRVFRLEKNNSWKQIGQDIIGIAAGDQAGRSVDLSSDGSVVAVGSKDMVQVFVYDRDYNFWYPLGRQQLTGDINDVFFGVSISLSNDGMVLMVAADVDNGDGKDSGKVQIFHYSQFFNEWNQLGQTFHGDIPVEAISLNGEGDIAALGVPNITATGITNAGLVRVYERTTVLTSTSWIPRGTTLREDEIGFGSSVDLSEDGMTLAISSKYGVHLYQFDTKIWDWIKINAKIQVEIENTTDIQNEIRVSLSPNGRTLAVSAVSSSSETVQVYKFNEDDSQWLTLGHVIKNSETEAGPAPSISLNSNTQIAVGFVQFGSEEDMNLGKVQVYELWE